ncbi:hypothetical protein OROMI_000980 [Orobanche minor]
MTLELDVTTERNMGLTPGRATPRPHLVTYLFRAKRVDASIHVGSRALPTLPNFIFDMTEAARIFSGRRHKLSILNNINGVLRPSYVIYAPKVGTKCFKQSRGFLPREIIVKGSVTSIISPRKSCALFGSHKR